MTDPGDDFGEFMDAIGKVRIASTTTRNGDSPHPAPPGLLVPPLPAELWALWVDPVGNNPASGFWVKSIDDARNGETYLVAFSWLEAVNAADHQNESYDLNCRPVRIK